MQVRTVRTPAPGIRTTSSSIMKSLADDLARIRTARRAARPRYYRPSKLDPYRNALEELRRLGASLGEIRIWLQQKANVEISRSGIARAFKRWQIERAS